MVGRKKEINGDEIHRKILAEHSFEELLDKAYVKSNLDNKSEPDLLTYRNLFSAMQYELKNSLYFARKDDAVIQFLVEPDGKEKVIKLGQNIDILVDFTQAILTPSIRVSDGGSLGSKKEKNQLLKTITDLSKDKISEMDGLVNETMKLINEIQNKPDRHEKKGSSFSFATNVAPNDTFYNPKVFKALGIEFSSYQGEDKEKPKGYVRVTSGTSNSKVFSEFAEFLDKNRDLFLKQIKNLNIKQR